MRFAEPVAPNGRWTLGLLTHGAGDPNSHNVWAGVASMAAERDANLICFPGKPLRSPLGFEAQSNILYDLVSNRSVDGLVIWASGLPLFVEPQALAAFCQGLQARGRRSPDRPLPLVAVGIPLEGLPGVRVDNYGGMRLTVEHLIDIHGRQRFAFVRGPEVHQEAAVRYQAFVDVLEARGLPLISELVFTGNFKESGGVSAVEKLIDQDRAEFDALVGASDNMAIGAMKALQARGIRVPEDVAVVGLNDEKQSAVVSPPLTTCPLHFYEQARKATEMVLALLEGHEIEQDVVLPTRLLARQSCGCADPRVIEAGRRAPAQMSPPDHPYSREAQLDAVLAILDASDAPVSRDLVAQLLDSFSAAIRTSAVWGPPMADRGSGIARSSSRLTDADRTLAVLGDILRQSNEAGVPLSRWQAVLSGLRRVLTAAGLTEEQNRCADDLFQQSRVLLGEVAQRAQAYEVLQAEAQSRRLAHISERLSTTVELAELLDILAETLPGLGVPACEIALYEDPERPADQARMVMGYGIEGRVPIEEGGLMFLAQDLVPRDLLPAGRRYSLVVEPLYFRDDQIGFAVMEGNARAANASSTAAHTLEEMYELLRGEISAALKRLQLLARNVELYRDAVRARVFAEEGRRLAEEANLLKSRFLATVSHELRTPLSLIVGAAEMILHEQAGSECTHSERTLSVRSHSEEAHGEQHAGYSLDGQLLKDVQNIQASAQHLARLISDVLDLASSQAGELKIVAERLFLSELLAEAATLGERMVCDKGLAFRHELPSILPVVAGDRTRLQQVILNLVSNAVKFTERGTITLWAEAGKDEVLIAVSDTGMGIPSDEQEVIFDEFRRSERTARRGHGGMGLGLAVSRRLVELHRGKIGVISSGTDGAGSTFYFTLPILEWPEEADAQPDSRLGVVLLLTERPDTAATLASHLGSRGFQVETLPVRDGESWLEQIIAAPPGAIVLDYEPAAEAGWRVMQSLKLNPGTREIPVLFYSLLEGQARGSMLALDYLAKPISSSALSSALARQGIDVETEAQRTLRTILIVDDEPGIVELHTRIVEANVSPCHVLTASNGVEALARMQQMCATGAPPDLVLLDLLMPEMDGFTVLQKMREMEGTRGTPVIVLTAQILSHDDLNRLQRGVTAVLGKGLFSTAEVFKQIEQALRRSKRVGTEGQRLARAVTAYLHEHFAEPIDREELARHFAVNERYLTRCFHQEMGIPPIAYLNRYRVHRACVLLEQGGISITETALATGFSDSAYFARVFQRETGMTPSSYRRRQRAGA